MDRALIHRRELIKSVNPVDNSVDAQIKRCAESLASKRIQALNFLGDRWVMHPQYNNHLNAHHSATYKISAVLAAFNIQQRQNRLTA